MKWEDLIKLIDPKQDVGSRYDSGVDSGEIQGFAEALRIPGAYWSEEFAERMHKHWVVSWLCTDSVVGLAVYCLDGVPVAVSSQQCRKCREDILFVSAESREAVRKAVLLYADDDGSAELADMQGEIDPMWFDLSGAEFGFKLKGV